MFSLSAGLYDLIYGFKDYRAEATEIAQVLRMQNPAVHSILDAACGTGEHARWLSPDFRVDGFDIQPEFAELAQSKNPDGRFILGDLESFEMGEQYDAVICLFSAIGYLLEPQAVVRCLQNFRRHLKPGGVVLVEPWLSPEAIRPGMPGMAPPVDLPELKVARMNISEVHGRISRFEFHYLVARPEGVEYFSETHQLALFTAQEMGGFFREAGFEASLEQPGLTGRGLWIASATA